MSYGEFGGEVDPLDSLGSDVITALNRFDRERNDLSDWMATLATKPEDVDAYKEPFQEHILVTTQAFGALVRTMIDGARGDIEMATDQVKHVCLTDDNERAKMFCGLFECDCFEATTYEEVETAVNELAAIAEDRDTLTESLSTAYGYFLGADANAFATHLQEMYRQSGRMNFKFEFEISRQQIKRGILGLAGVTVGLAASSMLLRRPQK